MPVPPPIQELPPDIQRRLMDLAAKAHLRGRGKYNRLRGKPFVSRLVDFVYSLQQTHFTKGLRYPSVAAEPLYLWSEYLGIPIWDWVGKEWTVIGTMLHPRCYAAMVQVLRDCARWERGEDLENLVCMIDRLAEYREANIQAAGFFSQVLDIVDDLWYGRQ